MSTPAYGTPYTPRYGAGPDPALSDEAMRDRQARGKDPYREDDEMPDAVVEEDEDHVAATISDAQARLRTGRG